jgi:hypothetical protein
MSFIEILVALLILSTSILALYTVIWRGLMLLKRGESVEIATNIAQGQFEAYEGNFHFIPFYQGTNVKNNTYYPEETPPYSNHIGFFVNPKVVTDDVPAGPTYRGLNGGNFYHDVLGSPNYDLNKDLYGNDLLEPMEPTVVEGIKFVPVVEVRAWANGFVMTEIKHLVITVYWKEKDTEAGPLKFKHITFEGYVVRTEPNPW